jgi:multicomponent Na+:H+ antiporter subunit D
MVTGAEAMIWAITIPFVAAILIPLFNEQPNRREGITVIAAVVLFGVVLSIVTGDDRFQIGRVELIEPIPGIAIAFRLEPLGAIFALVASLLWIVSSLFGIGYMRGNNEPRQTRFYVSFAVAIGSTMGICFADNLLTLFIFYEALTISTYPLVTHHKNEDAIKSGRTYLGILMSTSIGFLLFAIIITYVETGTLDFVPGGILSGQVSPFIGNVLLLLFMYGVGKAALMPIHRWLPAAMVAPTPVSALLHAVAVVKAGVFSVVKIAVYIFGLDFLQELPASDIILYMAGFTIIAASIVAIRQDNLKRRLAYSTISQLSYVILAMFILTPISTVAAALHIAVHAFGKITLFMVAGAIYTAAHKTLVSQLNGIGRRMPITMAAFAIGSLSMIGVPPAAGFLSKWYMVQGALEAEQVFALIVILISTLLNAAYFLPIVHAAFLKPEDESDDKYDDHGEAPVFIVSALIVTAALTILLLFFPSFILDLANGLIGA